MLDRVYLEISNICNVQCSFCPVVERDKDILSPADFEKRLLEVKDHAKQICLHLMGEPLAHPQIGQILEICERHQSLVQITTNGLLIKRHTQLLLDFKYLRQINFSLQSYTDNFPHKPVEDYLEKLLKFVDRASSQRSELYINFRLWNLDADKTVNEPVLSYLERALNISINRQVDVGHRKSKRIYKKLYLHFDSRFEWPTLDREVLNTKGRCHGLTSHIGIHSNGVVVPCCLDQNADISLGRIQDSGLLSILESDRAIKMKRGFAQGELVEDLCQRCGFIQRFNK